MCPLLLENTTSDIEIKILHTVKYHFIALPLPFIAHQQIETVRNRGINIICKKQRVVRKEYTRMSQTNKHAVDLLGFMLKIK